MLTILANPFVYDLQRIRDIVLTPDSCVLFVHQFEDGKQLTISSGYPTFCSLLSDTTLSGKLCNLHTLFLKSLANPSAIVSSIIATKCIIFDSLSQTTNIASFPATIGNLVIKSTEICVYGFSGTSSNFNFPTTSSVLFFILWHKSYPSTYHPTFLVTTGHQ